ncbi:MAG: ABC transporter permease [Bacteroidaceae bacterium]|nr:ABC transporter permease [Bacteroidaceae bacterium]
MNFELFIAKRLYLSRKGGKKISRPAVTIAQWGVTIGLIVMMISLAIVVGFKNEVRDKIIGFGGEIQINNYETAINGDSYISITDNDVAEINSCEGVLHAQRYVQKPGLLAVGDEYEGVLVKGIDKDYDTSFFEQHLVGGNIPNENDSINGYWIVISNIMAKKLNCTIGDKINVYFIQESIKARRMLITGIYETHLQEMDNIFAITDIKTTRRLNGWNAGQATGVEIFVTEYEKVEETRNNIATIVSKIAERNQQSLYIQTTEELNPALFAWLGVLNQTVWVILVLVLGIAGFTMTSGLLIIILEKSSLIGILKAVGAHNISIRKVFLYYSCFVIGKGMLLGNIIAILLCLLQEYTGIIALDPEMYYMNKVPIEFSWIMIPMNIFMFIISVAMLLVPSMLISKIEPSKAIKFE